MSFWTAMVIIVAIWAAVEAYKARQGIVTDWSGNERLERPAAQVDEAAQRELAELRERVKVLERMATEDREARRLSHEIEELRERP